MDYQKLYAILHENDMKTTSKKKTRAYNTEQYQ